MSMTSQTSPGLNEIIAFFKSLQDEICAGLEILDGSRFHEDLWERPGGGGGRTRIIQGNHIQKGGVNFSSVHGQMPDPIARSLNLSPNQFHATGVSIVLHPTNPWVPIIHMNVRYFETDQGPWWFGGGIDLTPHLIIPDDACYFHRKLKTVCDLFDDKAYQEYKEWADEYFFIRHRHETRGVGGIFFDRLSDDKGYRKEDIWKFVREIGLCFLPLYTDIFQRRYESCYTDEEKEWQMERRARYVEFNLVYDRGTRFGLETGGRIESILMSLPPQAQWPYHVHGMNEEQQKRLTLYRKGIDWINYKSR